MPTINTWSIVDGIIKNDGYFEDDPRVMKIVRYTNKWNGTSYGIVYKRDLDQNRYEVETEHVRNPEVIFRTEKH